MLLVQISVYKDLHLVHICIAQRQHSKIHKLSSVLLKKNFSSFSKKVLE